jgi:hypothetical protein
MRKLFFFILVIVLITTVGCVSNPQPRQFCAWENKGSHYLQNHKPPELLTIENWDNQFGPGMKLVTRHYEIYTTCTDILILSDIPAFMESAYKSYEHEIGVDMDNSARFKVYIFADRIQWECFTREFASAQADILCKIKAGAYCYQGACVAYNIDRNRIFSAIGHEGWHQFNRRHFHYRLPSWLDEGMAMLFETSVCENGIFLFKTTANSLRLKSLLKTMQSKNMIPLSTLIRLDPGQVVETQNSRLVTAFYCQSYALVRFLRETDLNSRFHLMLTDGVWGDRNVPLTIGWNRQMGELIFRSYIDPDFAKVEKAYLRFCTHLVNKFDIVEGK